MGLRRQERKALSLLNNLRHLSEIEDVSVSWDLHGNLFENLHSIHAQFANIRKAIRWKMIFKHTKEGTDFRKKNITVFTCVIYLIIIGYYCGFRNQTTLKISLLKFYPHRGFCIRDAFFATACPSIIIIIAEFTLFLLAWIINLSDHSSTHSMLCWFGNAYDFIAVRLPARLAGFTRPDIINLRREFHGTARSYRRRRDMAKCHRATPRHKRARTCESTHDVAHGKSYLRHALDPRSPRLSSATRETCPREIWQGHVSGRVIFSFFPRPRNLISATPARRRAWRDPPFRLSLSTDT